MNKFITILVGINLNVKYLNAYNITIKNDPEAVARFVSQMAEFAYIS